MYQWLDRAPKGRNEKGVWWRRHDEYGVGEPAARGEPPGGGLRLRRAGLTGCVHLLIAWGIRSFVSGFLLARPRVMAGERR
jgi:hypothetical protein